MTTDDAKQKGQIEKLKKDISVLKGNVHNLKKILIQINFSEQEEKDKEELKEIEAQME
jgi:hypothetical protein